MSTHLMNVAQMYVQYVVGKFGSNYHNNVFDKYDNIVLKLNEHKSGYKKCAQDNRRQN